MILMRGSPAAIKFAPVTARIVVVPLLIIFGETIIIIASGTVGADDGEVVGMKVGAAEGSPQIGRALHEEHEGYAVSSGHWLAPTKLIVAEMSAIMM